MKINLNQKIKVKLTQRGKEYLKKRHTELYKKQSVLFKLPDEDLEGYSIWQLWDFIGVFGNAFQFPTLNPVVEPDIFLIN